MCDLLEEHGELDPSEVEVTVEGSTVTLSGSVDSRRAKRLAEDIAESVTGVADVNNQLKVRVREWGTQSDKESSGAEGTHGRSGSEGSSSR